MHTVPSQTFTLEKDIWTDADFDVMGWHDSRIYQIELGTDLSLDIDYIFQWNQPQVQGMPFTFWIAPATLVFTNAKVKRFDIVTAFFEDAFEIDHIEKEPTQAGLVWHIITQRGHMKVEADGYIQYIRQQPSFQFDQQIPYQERGGISLERATGLQNAWLQSEEYLRQRARKEELYGHAQRYRQVKNELDDLTRNRDMGAVNTKVFLQEKKRLNELMFSHAYWIKGTEFESAAGLK